MSSLFWSPKASQGLAGGQPALPPAMTPEELALVEAYFDRERLKASLKALFGTNRESPRRHRVTT